MDGHIFNPIGILCYKYEVLPEYGKIPQYLFEFSESLTEWNVSLKSKTDNTSHLELSNTEMYLSIKEKLSYSLLFLCLNV